MGERVVGAFGLQWVGSLLGSGFGSLDWVSVSTGRSIVSTFLTLVRVEIVVTWMRKISAQSLKSLVTWDVQQHMWFCS